MANRALNCLMVSVCALLAPVSAPARAQAVKSWGILGGLTSSEHTWEPDNPFGNFVERKLSGHAGGYIEWLDVSFLSIVTQLAYVQKGVGLDAFVTDESGQSFHRQTYESHLNYLSLPMLVKAAVPSSSLSPYVIAGPRLDLFLGTSADTYLFRALYDEFRDVVVGMTVGGGLQAGSVLPAAMFVEFRYNIDLTTSFSGGNPDLVDRKIKNESVDVSVGVGIK